MGKTWKSYDKGDPMPDSYRAMLIHLMSFQGDSEFAGAQRMGENMRFAPRPEEAYRLARQVMEGMGHAYYVWNLMQDLGVDVDSRVTELAGNADDPDPARVCVIDGFRKADWNRRFEGWADVALFSTVVAPAALTFLGQYRDCSYLPWAAVNSRLHKEEYGHLAFGVWAAKRVAQFGGEAAREDLQDRVPKFLALGLGFFGRPSAGAGRSASFERYYEVGLKTRRPEEMQAEYLELLDRRLKEVGLVLPSGVEPDYALRSHDETGTVPVALSA